MNRLITIAVLLMIGALVLVGCSEESPEDEARNDGKAYGEAVRAVFGVESADELRDALEAIAEAEAALQENFGPEERALVMGIIDDVGAILASLQDAIEAESDEEVRAAVRSALEELPSLAVSIAAVSSDDSIVKAAVEGIGEGLGF